jgi:NTP pyrophosphatase (non-canonical NTP hydrolase)
LVKFSVENDDLLIRLATIAQRITAAEMKGPSDDGFLSEAERAQLLEEVKSVADEMEKHTKEKVDDIELELQEIQDKLEKRK